MAENFASFDYRTQEEVLTVLKYLTSLLSTTGMQLVEALSPSHLLKQLHEGPAPSGEVSHSSRQAALLANIFHQSSTGATVPETLSEEGMYYRYIDLASLNMSHRFPATATNHKKLRDSLCDHVAQDVSEVLVWNI